MQALFSFYVFLAMKQQFIDGKNTTWYNEIKLQPYKYAGVHIRKVYMKRITAFALAIVMMLSLIGCSSQKPETVVEDCCKAIQAFDMEKAAACMQNGEEDLKEFEEMQKELEGEEDTYEWLLLYLKECASKMTYTIGEVKTEGDSATVAVSFTYTNVSPIVTSVAGEYIVQAMTLTLIGADEAQLVELLVSIFKDKVETIEPGTASADVTFNCVKVDGKWKLAEFSDEDSNTMANIATANLIKALESFGTN
ncbi:MAG: hypothetical protein PUH36_05075 [Subdoligranulum sp.]|nr:hypothetical protein [Subdoligranulum sp.]